MMGYGSMNEWSWLWMLVPTLLFISVIVFGAWTIARTPGNGRNGREAGALTILEARYARGEIDRDEFEGRRRDIDLR